MSVEIRACCGVARRPLFAAVAIGLLSGLCGLRFADPVRVVRAAAPGDAAENEASADRPLWAFEKPVRPRVPPVQYTERLRTPLDAFVLARLEERGLTLSPEAPRAVLVRRAHLDLIGLPPSSDEVEAFVTDTAADAYDRLIDRLLASPRFGERWGRHWLDVVGYVDTVGFDFDANNIIVSEGKWRYRDYVIAAWNADKPYDRFVTEQLAGDELAPWRTAAQFTPEIRGLLAATGFLRTAQDFTHEPESNIPSNHYAVLHDTVEIVAGSLLGLTVNCARCHAHKFDPIPQEDYYRLMAIFTPAYNPHDWKAVFPYNDQVPDRALADVSAAEQAQIEEHNRQLDGRVAELERQLGDLRRPYEERLLEDKLAAVPEPIRADTKAAVATAAESRNEVQKYLADKFAESLKIAPDEVAAALNETDRLAVEQIDGRIAALKSQRRGWGKIQALFDVGPPPATHLLEQGDFQAPGDEVSPGFLSALCAPEGLNAVEAAAATSDSSGRRTALARWLTAPDTPAAGLAARVLVNRIWQHLFGQGIVATPENFGTGGERPTHPELLDWLSVEFIEGGWRVKPLIRLMMTSSTYRQASRQVEASAGQADPASIDPASIDPDNRLLWRMRLRRLESEAIRDCILAVSGKLDPTMGGPPIYLDAQADGLVTVASGRLPSPTARWRRSVYLLARRAYNLSLLTVFDQPLVATTCQRRDASAVPLQSLTMLNDAFLFEQAEHLASRAALLAGSSPAQQIDTAFRLALARPPDEEETAWCDELLERQSELYRADGRSAEEAAHQALVNLCHTLLNTSEFLYVE